MTVKGFPGTGIFAINQTNLTYNRNTAIDNDEYGMAAFQTVGTQMTHNTRPVRTRPTSTSATRRPRTA